MYQLQQKSDSLYFFVTDCGIQYAIEFLPLNEIFSYQNYIQIDTFLLNINVSSKITYIPFDPSVAETIAKLVNDFLQDTSKCCVFNCDTSDGRQAVRYRKFDFWYKKFNDGSFLKYNKTVVSPKNNTRFYTSLMIRHSSISYRAVEWYENWLDNYSK